MFYTEQFLDKNLKSTLGLNWADNRILNGRRHQIQGAQDLAISDPLNIIVTYKYWKREQNT